MQNKKQNNYKNDFAMDEISSMLNIGNDFQYDPKKKKTKLSRKEQKEVNKLLKEKYQEVMAENRKNTREYEEIQKKNKQKAKSIASMLKERDKAISEKTKGDRAKRIKANNTSSFIGYERMFKNGICEVEKGIFSQTIEFSDISYQSAREDTQKDIFETICDIYNYFPTGVSMQMSIINTKIAKENVGNRQFYKVDKQLNNEAKHDAEVFNQVLNQKMKEGVSNIKRRRLLSYAIAAENLDASLPGLARIRTDLKSFFNKIGCNIKVLSGHERLELIHNIFDPNNSFNFDYDRCISIESGLTTKDYVAPQSLDFSPNNQNDCFRTNDVWAKVVLATKITSELNDRAISDIIDLPIPMNITWFAQRWDRAEATAWVKSRNTWVDKEIVEEQGRSARRGQDFTVLPREMRDNSEVFNELMEQIVNKNQNLFTYTGLVYVTGKTQEELNDKLVQIVSIARTKNIEIQDLPLKQREGINSILPLANNYMSVSRIFTTAQVSILMPFATQELDEIGGNYVGQNKNSNNLVIFNRKNLNSPVGFITGITGSGKSFFVKQEIEGTILQNPNDQIIIFDRAGEYTMLAKHHHGTLMEFGPEKDTYLNPFDLTIQKNKSIEHQIGFKADAMIAQASAAARQASKGLTEEESSLISRVVELAYYRANEKEPGSVPLLEDFYELLKEQPEDFANTIALRYERYVRGAQSFFNHHSNVNWNNRIIDINIKELPDSMLIFCLIIMCENARNQMYANFEKGKRTWIYVEEIQSMFEYPSVLNYFARFAAEARKFGGLITGLSQNSTAILDNEKARPIVLNSKFVMLLEQSPEDREAWVQMLRLSQQEEGYIDATCSAGEGLLVAGANRIPIVGGFPKGNHLYDLFSTDPNEVEEEQLKKEFLEKQKQQIKRQIKKEYN